MMPRSSVISLLALALWGCELPPIPLDPMDEADQRGPDQAREPDIEGSVCEAGARGCLSRSQAYSCDATGSLLSVLSCLEDERCEEGECKQVQDTCAPGELVRLTPSELVFETPPDLKSQTAQINLTNCSAHPIRVMTARIDDAPTHADGAPVFAFDAVSPQGLELPPGDAFNVKVIYQPRAALYQDRAKLAMVAQELDGPRRRVAQEATLRTRSLCLSASPQLDLGIFVASDQLTTSAPWALVNCGSEPLRLDALELTPWQEQRAPELLLVDEGNDPLIGAVLEPGQHVAARLLVRRATSGPLNATLTLRAAPIFTSQPPQAARLEAKARLTGFVRAAGSCAPGQAPELRLLRYVYDTPVDMGPGPWRVAPGSLVRLEPAAAAAMYYEVETLRPEALPYGSTLLARPLKVQTHRIRAFAFDAFGVQRCEPREAELEVLPQAPLYAELEWETLDDPVPDDEGAALGVDLDLYVHDALALGSESAWLDESSSCAAPVWLEEQHELCATLDEELCQQLLPRPCAGGRGSLMGTSMSGAGVEAIQLDEAPQVRADLGVRLVAQHGWRGAAARLRVWRYGVLEQRLGAQQLMITQTPTFVLAGLCQPMVECTPLMTLLPEPR